MCVKFTLLSKGRMLLPTVSSLQLRASKETTSVTTWQTKEAANDTRQAIYISIHYN